MIFVIHSEPFYLNLKPSLQDKSNYFLIDIKKKNQNNYEAIRLKIERRNLFILKLNIIMTNTIKIFM